MSELFYTDKAGSKGFVVNSEQALENKTDQVSRCAPQGICNTRRDFYIFKLSGSDVGTLKTLKIDNIG